MMNDLISIIVPIYNVELYLRQCVWSLINQTYRNIEIILVDDGSTDSCSDLCDSLAQEDSRIIVVHKENGGLSDARNAGLDICNGQYVSFIDSDDYVASDYIESLYSIIYKCNLKISACPLLEFIGKDIVEVESSGAFKIYPKEQAIKSILKEEELTTSACGKLFHRELFNFIRFPKGKIYEDLFTIWKLIDKVDSIGFLTIPKYYYRMNPQSIMHTSFSIKNLDIIEAHKSIIEYVHKSFPELEKYAYWRYTRYNIAYLYRLIKSRYEDDKILHMFVSEIKKNICSYCFSHYPLTSKLLGIMVSSNVKITKKILVSIQKNGIVK